MLTPEQIARGPTDDHVWAALDAAQAEAATWRILDFRGGGAIAVNDLRPTPENIPENHVAVTESYERIDFRDAASARQYISWRSMKAALAQYSAVRAELERNSHD